MGVEEAAVSMGSLGVVKEGFGVWVISACSHLFVVMSTVAGRWVDGTSGRADDVKHGRAGVRQCVEDDVVGGE